MKKNTLLRGKRNDQNQFYFFSPLSDLFASRRRRSDSRRHRQGLFVALKSLLSLLLLLQSTRRPKFRQEKAGCRNLRLWWKGPRASAVSCHFNIRHGPLLELKERWKDNSSPRTSFFPYDICRKKGGRPAI